MTDFSGFYKLTIEERLKRIKQAAALSDEEIAVLTDSGALRLAAADKIVENVIGAIHLPLGIATGFVINGKPVIVPMAIEEPSVIAAASKAAKQAQPSGFKADTDEPIMIGQIQVVGAKDPAAALRNIEINRKEIMHLGTIHMKPHERYGCGLKRFEAKAIETERGTMIILHFHVNVGDAQGANMVNTLMENLAPTIAHLCEGKVRLRIVSNLAMERRVRATAVWRKDVIGEEAIEGILDAYELARSDIYRCATHNKGIMNGVDAVAMATGNDWRSVEAGAHVYAALGAYRPLTRYQQNEKGDLVGSIELPLALGVVGPAVNSSPTARIALKIAGVKSSRELAMMMACVGLANNMAALQALSTEGIQKGHMRLHARNIALFAGASTSEEADAVAAILSEANDFNPDKAKEALALVRKSSGKKK